MNKTWDKLVLSRLRKVRNFAIATAILGIVTNNFIPELGFYLLGTGLSFASMTGFLIKHTNKTVIEGILLDKSEKGYKIMVNGDEFYIPAGDPIYFKKEKDMILLNPAIVVRNTESMPEDCKRRSQSGTGGD